MSWFQWSSRSWLNISRRNFFYNIHSLNHLTKRGVLIVQVLALLACQADKKLTASAIRMRAASHAERARRVLFLVELGPYLPTWTASSIAFGASTLNHKVGNHAMKKQAIIKPFLANLRKLSA